MDRRARKHGLLALASLVLGAISGVLGALLTWRFWGWFENATGIESLGHSGPADWVFVLMFVLCAALIFAVLESLFRERIVPPQQ